MLRDTYIDGKTLKKSEEMINTKFRMVVTQKRKEKDLIREGGVGSSKLLVKLYLSRVAGA